MKASAANKKIWQQKGKKSGKLKSYNVLWSRVTKAGEIITDDK